MKMFTEKFEKLMEELQLNETPTVYQGDDQRLYPSAERRKEKISHEPATGKELDEIKEIFQQVKLGRNDYVINFFTNNRIHSINTFMIDKPQGIKEDHFIVNFMGKTYNIDYSNVIKVYEPYRFGFMQKYPVPDRGHTDELTSTVSPTPEPPPTVVTPIEPIVTAPTLA